MRGGGERHFSLFSSVLKWEKSLEELWLLTNRATKKVTKTNAKPFFLSPQTQLSGIKIINLPIYSHHRESHSSCASTQQMSCQTDGFCSKLIRSSLLKMPLLHSWVWLLFHLALRKDTRIQIHPQCKKNPSSAKTLRLGNKALTSQAIPYVKSFFCTIDSSLLYILFITGYIWNCTFHR